MLRGRAFEALGEELMQTLRQKLLVGGPDGAAKLAQYGARGPLSKWLRAVATRTAISLGRGADRAEPEADMDERALAAPDPELQYIRARYRQPFRAAFREALEGLSVDHRTVLRMHFVEGLSHEQIARLSHVHQTTATRRIAGARAALVSAIRRRLGERLRMSPRELESLVRAVRSELDVSLGALMPGAAE